MSESLTITAAAIQAVKEAIEAEHLSQSETFLRVGVRAGGCSGFSYDLQFVNEAEGDDSVLERGGVRFLLDPKSETFLKGTELDFSSGLSGKGFVFRNPNAESTCGCGESFSV